MTLETRSELPISAESNACCGHFLSLQLQTTTAETRAVGPVEDTCLTLENRVPYETTTSFDEKMLPFVQSDLAESIAAGDEADTEDAMFSAMEDRIDSFLESEGVFVAHVDDAKQALFGPFASRSRLSQRLPATRSSLNISK